MTASNPSSLSTRFKKPSQRFLAYSFYIAGVIASLMAAVVLVSAQI